MGYTSFGEYLRIQRIKHHEVMGDLVKVLGTSTPFLSAVENGKKNIPEGWIEKLIAHYGLNDEEQQHLVNAAEESKVVYKITPKNAGTAKRRAAMQFARSFDNMDDETAMKIVELLNKRQEADNT